MDLKSDTPWGRIQQSGIASANIVDLLAICGAREPQDAEGTYKEAYRLISELKPERLNNICQADLRVLGGLESYEADRILAAMELGRRSAKAGRGEVREVSDAETGAREIAEFLGKASEERFCIALMSVKNTVIGIREIHRGTRDSSLVDPKIVFGKALKEDASRIILGHNHPSGDPEPSPEDISITRQLVGGGRILGVEVIDHIIIGHSDTGDLRYTSLRRRGLM